MGGGKKYGQARNWAASLTTCGVRRGLINFTVRYTFASLRCRCLSAAASLLVCGATRPKNHGLYPKRTCATSGASNAGQIVFSNIFLTNK